MSITYKQESAIYQAGYDYGPVSLDWPAPLPKAALVVNSNSRLCIEWQGVTEPVEIQGGTITVAGSGYNGTLTIHRGVFPQSASGTISFAKVYAVAHSRCSITVSFDLSPASIPRSALTDSAGTFVASLVSQKFPNVCLSFPRSGRSLWVNRSTLVDIAPFYRTLFSSEFSEVTDTRIIAERVKEEEDGDPAVGNVAPYEYDDSDEETDEATKILSKESEEAGGVSYQTITITQHTYETYLALLCWVGTGDISFAPLRSTFAFPVAAGPEMDPLPTRSDAIFDSFNVEAPRSPVPVSPKSIYRLAHFLELGGDLPDLALANFRSQLTVENVMHELYTNVASKYPEIRDVALDFAVKNWKTVVVTSGYQVAMSKGEQGELDGLTGFLLSQKLMKVWAK